MRRRLAIVLSLLLVLSLLAPTVASARPQTASRPRASVVQPKDAYESADDTWTTAPNLGNTVTNHTFTSIEGDGRYTRDVDWFKVSVTASDTPILVNVLFLGGDGGSYLDVFESDGSKCATDSIAFFEEGDHNSGEEWLGGYDPAGWWMSGMAHAYFVAPHPGTYYFRHRSDDGASGMTARDMEPEDLEGAPNFELRVTVGDADRLAGASRYATSAYVARMMWNGSENPWWWEGPWGNGVIIASGENFADGLAATTLSLRSGNPVMLTGKDFLPSDVANEIVRLGAEDFWNDEDFTVYVAGSSAAISDAVVNAIKALPHVSNVERIAGANRYATAAAFATAADDQDLMGLGPFSLKPSIFLGREAFIINGNAWPDGLAAGPVAAFAGAPLLMVTPTSVPASTAAWIEDNDVTRIHVVGGPSVVPTSVVNALAALSTTPTVDRIAGATRYETAFKLAEYGIDNYGMEPGATLVSGESPWDALSGGQVSFMTYEPLMLTPRDSLSPYVTQLYDEYGFDYANYAIGGPPAIGVGTFNAFRDLWKRPKPVEASR